MNQRIASISAGMGVLVSTAFIGPVFADTRVVDWRGGPDVYTTIQDAVDHLPNPGPRTIIVRAGIYNEALRISAKNTLATNDSRQIVIMVDTNALGQVIVMPPSAGSSGVYLNQSHFIVLRGLVITGVSGKNVPAVELDGDNEDIAIVGCQIHHNDSCGIQVGSGNPRTWIMNNLIHDNGISKKTDHGVTIAGSVGATVYVVNNTIVRSKADGVFMSVPGPLYLVNNLIVSNGENGFECSKGSGTPAAVTLLYNMFYANTSGDIVKARQDTGCHRQRQSHHHRQEGAGVVGCTFPNCGHTDPLTELFVNPDAAAAYFHLAAGSPAIDRGVNTFSDGSPRGRSWKIWKGIRGHRMAMGIAWRLSMPAVTKRRPFHARGIPCRRWPDSCSATASGCLQCERQYTWRLRR